MMKNLAVLGIVIMLGLFGVSSAMSPIVNISHSNNADVVLWAHEKGMTKFSTWNNFGADMAVTREQAAKIIATRISSHHELNRPWSDASCSFHDENTIDPSLTQSVELACHFGLFKGYQGAFMPKKQLTTQDTLTLLSRAKGLLKDTNVDLPIPQLMGHYLSRGDLIKGLYALHVYLEAKMNAEQDAKLAIAQANLDAAMSTWEAKNLSNYKARQQLSCFCAPASTHPITFEVESDVVVQGSIQDVSETGALPPSELQVEPQIVEDLFMLIQNAIDNRAESITVSYDAELGYPTSIGIDYNAMIADEEMYYSYEIVQTY